MPEVNVSSLIDSPLEKVWEVLRDFNALPSWHPRVATSHIENDRPADSIGCIRNFQLTGTGETIREQLLALSDVEHFCTYSILEAPLAVRNYVATVQLRRVTTTNQTFGQWQARFDTPADEKAATVAVVTEIFEEGFASIVKQ